MVLCSLPYAIQPQNNRHVMATKLLMLLGELEPLKNVSGWMTLSLTSFIMKANACFPEEDQKHLGTNFFFFSIQVLLDVIRDEPQVTVNVSPDHASRQ